MKALEGLLVLDLTHALAGAFCTYHLGLLGGPTARAEPQRPCPGPRRAHDEVLHELGYSDAGIAKMHETGAV